MAVKDQFRIINVAEAKGLKCEWGGDVQDGMESLTIAFPKAGDTSDNNFFTNLGGFKRMVTFNFRLTDDGNARGYNTSGG